MHRAGHPQHKIAWAVDRVIVVETTLHHIDLLDLFMGMQNANRAGCDLHQHGAITARIVDQGADQLAGAFARLPFTCVEFD
jgi:hypothetical protein